MKTSSKESIRILIVIVLCSEIVESLLLVARRIHEGILVVRVSIVVLRKERVRLSLLLLHVGAADAGHSTASPKAHTC